MELRYSAERVLKLGAQIDLSITKQKIIQRLLARLIMSSILSVELETKNYHEKGGHLVSLRARPNGAFAKQMNLTQNGKQIILGLQVNLIKWRKIWAIHSTFYLFVESNEFNYKR